ncbi:MAG: heavy-metal-associated domain-containing protein [Solobacterium sp.]|nr:heavy-metal-associated domain-containing protein [Solobacterium sp.]
MTTTKKKKKTTNTKTRKRRSGNRTAIIFWVCLALILIPALIFGWVLISAAMDTGKPVVGDRFKDDLNPAITKDQLSDIKNGVKNVTGVESVDVQLASGTLRVYADIEDSAGGDTVKARCSEVYSAVTSVLDPAVYFSQHDNMKMYDLEVHVYNLSDDRDSDAFAYAIETKTSYMAEPQTQLVSEPVNAELAQQLRDAVEQRNNPTPTPEETDEMTVGGEDTEEGTN